MNAFFGGSGQTPHRFTSGHHQHAPSLVILRRSAGLDVWHSKPSTSLSWITIRCQRFTLRAIAPAEMMMCQQGATGFIGASPGGRCATLAAWDEDTASRHSPASRLLLGPGHSRPAPSAGNTAPQADPVMAGTFHSAAAHLWACSLTWRIPVVAGHFATDCGACSTYC